MKTLSDACGGSSLVTNMNALMAVWLSPRFGSLHYGEGRICAATATHSFVC